MNVPERYKWENPNMFIYKHNYSRKNDQESVKKHCIYTYMTSIQSTDQFPFSPVHDSVVSVKEFQCSGCLCWLNSYLWIKDTKSAFEAQSWAKREIKGVTKYERLKTFPAYIKWDKGRDGTITVNASKHFVKAAQTTSTLEFLQWLRAASAAVQLAVTNPVHWREKKGSCTFISPQYTVNVGRGVSVNIFQWSSKQAHTKPSIE